MLHRPRHAARSPPVTPPTSGSSPRAGPPDPAPPRRRRPGDSKSRNSAVTTLRIPTQAAALPDSAADARSPLAPDSDAVRWNRIGSRPRDRTVRRRGLRIAASALSAPGPGCSPISSSAATRPCRRPGPRRAGRPDTTPASTAAADAREKDRPPPTPSASDHVMCSPQASRASTKHSIASACSSTSRAASRRANSNSQDVAQRWPPPQPQRLLKQLARPRRSTATTRCPPDQPLKAAGVDKLGVDVQPVPGRRAPHRDAITGRTQQLAQRRHVHLHRMRGGRRWSLSPQLVDQLVAGHLIRGVKQQKRDDRALLAATSARASPASTISSGPRILKSTEAPNRIKCSTNYKPEAAVAQIGFESAMRIR